MKRSWPLFLAVFAVIPLLRCTGDQTAPIPENPAARAGVLDTDQARNHYLQSLRRIRSRDAADTTGLLPVGTVLPDWDAARASDNDYLSSLDIPVGSPFRYTLLTRTRDGIPYAIELLLRLVSIKAPTDGHIAEYLLLFLPDLDYDMRNRGERVWKGVLNSGDMQDFTGVLLYTTLDGIPACAARFNNGQRIAAAYMGDTTRTPEQNIERLFGITGSLAIRVESSRSGSQHPGRMAAGDPNPTPDKDSITWHFPIDDVVCSGKRPPTSRYIFLWYNSQGGSGGGNPRPPADPPTAPPGGGGGGGEFPDHGKSKPGDRIISDKPEVDSLVDRLVEDCMGQLLLSLLESDITVVTDDPACGNHYDHTSRTVYFDAWDKSHAMIVLIEELTHAYQFQQEGAAGYSSHGLNNEIEAKMGWYIYTIRNHINLDLKRFLAGTDGINFFSSLEKYYSSHYINNVSYNSIYDLIVQKFRENATYANEAKYKESSNHRDFKNLDILMADCYE